MRVLRVQAITSWTTLLPMCVSAELCKQVKALPFIQTFTDVLFAADGPTDAIPRACQLNSDVSQVTQLLNMNKLRPPEQKYGGRPLTSPESGRL